MQWTSPERSFASSPCASCVAFHFFSFLVQQLRGVNKHSELSAISTFLSALLSNLWNMTEVNLFCSGPTSGGSHDGLIPWTRFCKVCTQFKNWDGRGSFVLVCCGVCLLGGGCYCCGLGFFRVLFFFQKCTLVILALTWLWDILVVRLK